MHSSGALVLTLLISLARSLMANPIDLWQRFQQRERSPRPQMPRALEAGPYGDLMLGQYYPLWAQGAILQLDNPATLLDDTDDRLTTNGEDYVYELTPERPAYTYGDESDNIATGVEEQAYKDLLMRYWLREMEEQEALPVVRRRSQYMSREERTFQPLSLQRQQQQQEQQSLDSESSPSSTSSTTTSTTTTTTTTTPKPTPVSHVQFQRGQKEVALLRPPSENKHRPLTWPQELEKTQTQREQHLVKQAQEKRMTDMAALPTAPKKQPKQALDILTAELNSLRSREH